MTQRKQRRRETRTRQVREFDIIEFLGTGTSGGRFSFWVWGVISAGLIALYGLTCVVTQSAHFLSMGRMRLPRIVEYTGSQGVALGVSYLAAAAYLHIHVCWSEHEQYYSYAAIAKAVSLLAAVGGLVYLAVDVVLLS